MALLTSLARIAAATLRAAANELDSPKRSGTERRDPASTTASKTELSGMVIAGKTRPSRQAKSPRPVVGFGPPS